MVKNPSANLCTWEALIANISINSSGIIDHVQTDGRAQSSIFTVLVSVNVKGVAVGFVCKYSGT